MSQVGSRGRLKQRLPSVKAWPASTRQDMGGAGTHAGVVTDAGPATGARRSMSNLGRGRATLLFLRAAQLALQRLPYQADDVRQVIERVETHFCWTHAPT